jgi:glycosyltransferase involved in cell wall biosynthesis
MTNSAALQNGDRSSAPPLVAVVTPVYNGANYLHELMDSVQAQTYPNLVHVVLDNCSSDATAEIIARFAEAHVGVITRRNASLLPLSANWNEALQLAPADAKYVRVVCHDDLLTPDAIERMVAVAERHPKVGVVVGDVIRFRQNNDEKLVATLWPDDVERVDGADVIRSYFRVDHILVANQVLFRKAAMAVRGREFYPEDLSGSDYDAVLAVLAKWDLGVVHAPVVRERLHGSSEGASTQEPWQLTEVEWMLTMIRHGPAAYAPAEWRDLYGRYRRRYLRRMFRRQFSAHGRNVNARHMAMIRGRGVRFTPWDHLAALMDGVPVKLGLKPGWDTFPW